MTTPQVPVGRRITLFAEFRNAGVLFDPTNVHLDIKQGGTVVATPVYPGTITKVSTGRYSFSYLVTVATSYKWRYRSTDDGVGSAVSIFEGQSDGF